MADKLRELRNRVHALHLEVDPSIVRHVMEAVEVYGTACEARVAALEAQLADAVTKREACVAVLRDVLWAATMIVGFGSESHRCCFCDCRAPDLAQMAHKDSCVIFKVWPLLRRQKDA